MIDEVPFAADCSLDDGSAEQRLAMAVIVTAARDAVGLKSVNESADARTLNQKAAIAWFRSGDDDFKEVCTLAGLEPSYVRDRVLTYLASNYRLPRRGSMQSGRKAAKPDRGRQIATIAQRAGVSPQSVRNVMNGDGKASAAMSRHVRAVMSQMGAPA